MEIFESGAFREETKERWDLMPAEYYIRLMPKLPNELVRLIRILTDPKAKLHIEDIREAFQFYKRKQQSIDLLEGLARTFHEGERKYGERTWEKGIPEWNLRSHALAHIVRYIAHGIDIDWNHALWNCMAILYFQDKQPKESQASAHGKGKRIETECHTAIKHDNKLETD
jgi:hypothetical protein